MTLDEYQDVLTKLALFHEDGHNPFKPCICGKAYQAVYEAMIGQEIERLVSNAGGNRGVYGFALPPEGPDTDGDA